jgi:hypothetical protein
MTRQILKQPDGKWALFDLETGIFVLLDCTAEEVASEVSKQGEHDARENAMRRIAAIERGHQPYGPSAITWGEALAEHLRHAPESNDSAQTPRSIGP